MNHAKSVLNILIDNCTNERLDAIVVANEDYKEIKKQASNSFQTLLDSLTPEQDRLFNLYTVNENTLSALYARLSYEQGLRDITELLKSLTVN